MVIATAAGVDLGTAAELGAEYDEGAFKEAFGFEVTQEGREGDIEFSSAFGEAFVDVIVHVPAAGADFDKTDAALNEAAGEDAALAEFVAAVGVTQRIRLFGEAEGFEIISTHECEGLIIELGVGFDVAVGKLATEAGVDLIEEGEAFLEDVLRDVCLGVLNAYIRIMDGKRAEGGGEEAVAVFGTAIDADAGGQRLVAGAVEVLGPSAHVGVLDGAALLITGADEVLAGSMDSGLRGHGTDDGDLVTDLGEFRHGAAELKAALGCDGIGWAFSVAMLGVERVDVAHATDHLKEDAGLGLAETGAGGGIDGASSGGAQRGATENAEAEGRLGHLFSEATAVEGINPMKKGFHERRNERGWLLNKNELARIKEHPGEVADAEAGIEGGGGLGEFFRLGVSAEEAEVE